MAHRSAENASLVVHRRPAGGLPDRVVRWRAAASWIRRLVLLTPLACAAASTHGETVVPSLAREEDRARFRVTAFATGLGFPTSMATLADGSLLVATSEGGTNWQANSLFASPRSTLVRLVDGDGDGVADGPPQTMAADLPGLVASVRRVGNLVFALSSRGGAETVTVWRTGASAVDPFTSAGRLSFSIPSGFEHTSYALAARPAPAGGVELYFNVGARQNSLSTPPEVTVGLSASDGASFPGGGSQAVAADSIHRVIVRDDGTALTVSAPLQIARGLRNAAGMVFDPAGNLWLEDNGIDTEGNRGVSFSADELNCVTAAELGVSVPNFGFADTYVRYSDGQTIGPTAGIAPPQAAFLPVDGRKSEGAVEVACAPDSFPADFLGGLFVPFSGKSGLGGAANDENPLVFVDPGSGRLFHFIDNGVMGHPNGVLATSAGLFLSDLNPTGRFGDPIGTGGVALTIDGVPADESGVVYLIAVVPEPTAWVLALVGCAAAVATLKTRASGGIRRPGGRGRPGRCRRGGRG